MTTHTTDTLTIVGLGPGGWTSLTLEADAVLRESAEVWLRTRVHPPLDDILGQYPDTTFHSFDSMYESLGTYDAVHAAIVDEIGRLVAERDSLVYAVPGSPAVAETTVRLLLDRYRESDTRVRVVQGLSELEPALLSAGITDASWVEVISAEEASLLGRENAVGEVPGVPGALPWRAPVVTAHLLITHLTDRDTAAGARLWLGAYYPDDHAIELIGPAERGWSSERLPLHELDGRPVVDHRTVVHVPPLSENENVRTFAGMMQLTRRLRGPGGCPWDREQTHASLKPHLLEETYEALDALDDGDPAAIAEEFGDLLYQITLHSQVAAEAGTFTIEDVFQNIIVKLIGRHPHVFGDLELESAQDVLHAWESFKQRQKPKRESIFEGIPRGLPALPQSNLMQKRAAGVGFEWPGVSDVIDKVEEELTELRAEIETGQSRERTREELGDIFFALVSVARHLKIDPEESLRLANAKFSTRFRHVEQRVKASGRALRDLTPEELDDHWNDAKAEADTPSH